MVPQLLLLGLQASQVEKVNHLPVCSSFFSHDAVYILAGNYRLATWVTLTGGTAVSINMDGIIYRTGSVLNYFGKGIC